MKSGPLTKTMHPLVLFLAVALLPTAKFTTASDSRNQPTLAATVTKDRYSGDGISTGFKVERYAQVWEHNPFYLVTPIRSQAQHSPFEKLFLTSWLSDEGKDDIFVQDSETNELQKITAEPNQNKLRLVELRSNPNPRLVEAIISDGRQQGALKFHFDVQSPVGQSASPVAQMPNTIVPGQAPNVAKVSPLALRQPTTNPPNATGSIATVPVSAPTNRSALSATNPEVSAGWKGDEAGSGMLPPGSEEVHLQPPGQ
jgi:hypothetical protein